MPLANAALKFVRTAADEGHLNDDLHGANQGMTGQVFLSLAFRAVINSGIQRHLLEDGYSRGVGLITSVRIPIERGGVPNIDPCVRVRPPLPGDSELSAEVCELQTMRLSIVVR